MSAVASEIAPLSVRNRSFQWDWVTWLLLAVLAGFIASAFAPLVKASFVDLDDNLYVYENPNVLNGLSLHSIGWALTTRTGGRYMPTTWLSLQLDATIENALHGGREEQSPGKLPDATVYHVTNIVLHVLAAWALFLFLYRATKQRWASFAVTLLWAVHPLRVESVAWVTERKDEIGGLFGFLALYWYVVAREKTPRAGRWWFWASCGSLVASLWAKAMFVTMPALLLIVDYWPLGRIRNKGDFRRAIIEKWPMWLIAGLSAIGTAYIGRNSNDMLPISAFGRAENAFISYIQYIAMEVNFGSLVPFYPYPRPVFWEACGAVAILGVITAAAIWQRRRFPWFFTGWVWYLIAFLPMIGFVQSFAQAYADRFSYLPVVGLFTALVFGAFEWRRGRAFLVTGTFGIALALSAFTYLQSQYWHDTITLFERTRDLTIPNSLVEQALGAGYGRAGRLTEAETAYLELVKLAPNVFWGHEGLAEVYANEGRLDEALPQARKAVEIEPNYTAHSIYGKILFLSGRYREAELEYESALKLQPDDAEMRDALESAREKAAIMP